MQDSNIAMNLLIVSNNVLSERRNNGKTILSFVDAIPKDQISQLYFNSEIPAIDGYSYFQITDKDIIRGKFNSRKRGKEINAIQRLDGRVGTSNIKRNSLTRLLREIIWWKSWKSKALSTWVELHHPDSLFFVAGDSCFAYDIVNYIVKKTGCRLIVYITDDYIMPRKRADLFERLRTIWVRKKMIGCINASNSYYTISPAMQRAYNEITYKSSHLLVNLSQNLYAPEERKKENDSILIVYAGSLYYGRGEILCRVAKAIAEYNINHAMKAVVNVYTNTKPSNHDMSAFEFECCKYCGSVGPEDLQKIYNQADILLFVESFSPEMVEKTRYSLSTKVPEYLSLRKLILAVGPQSIGSMDYLRDCAFCINNNDEIEEKVKILLNNRYKYDALIEKAQMKYEMYHNKEAIQKKFIESLFFDGNIMDGDKQK